LIHEYCIPESGCQIGCVLPEVAFDKGLSATAGIRLQKPYIAIPLPPGSSLTDPTDFPGEGTGIKSAAQLCRTQSRDGRRSS
jgi:hypothetical protein